MTADTNRWRSAVRVAWLTVVTLAMSACATWQAPSDTGDAPLRARATTLSKGGVQLSAAVLGPEDSLRLFAVGQKMPHRLNCTHPHFRRAAAGKKAEHHLFPQPFVAACAADLVELTEPAFDLFLPCSMSFDNGIDRNRDILFFHAMTKLQASMPQPK